MFVGRRKTIALLMLPLGALTLGCSDDDSPTAPGNGPGDCLSRANFSDPSASPWVLPYPVGSRFNCTQSYCNPNGGHNNTFAYDFGMPLGAPITASRAGMVIVANDQYADDDQVEGHENNVFVEHGDGSVVRYTHLKQGSVAVEVGDVVVKGQLLGENGSSGNTGGFPHLHFEVFASRNYAKSNALPVNFLNAEGQLDSRGGLVAGQSYEAVPY